MHNERLYEAKISIFLSLQKRQEQQARRKAFQTDVPEGIREIYAKKPSTEEQSRRVDARVGESLKGKDVPKGQGGRIEPEYVI